MNFALVGAPGSGKSSIADALGVRMSFADGVRREVAGALAPVLRFYLGSEWTEDETLADMTDPERKDIYRPLLQVWGTDFRRAQDPNYWVSAMVDRLYRSKAEDIDRCLVVDDCRFPNEYAALQTLGFYFVRLESGANTRPLTGAQLAHESERYWPQFKVDLVLDYQPGPEVQAQRIREAFGVTE